MPRKIPLTQMREWLKSYEEGKSEASIARDARRDVRTVKRGIEQARREQDVHNARAELLKDALKKHQGDLLGVINGVLSALVVPPHNLQLGQKRHARPTPIPLSGATASHEAGKGWTVVLHVEKTSLWGLLQEHLKRDPLWNTVAAWEKALVAHLQARIALVNKTAALLEQKTGYKLVDKPVDPPFLYLYPTIELFYQVALNKTIGVPDGTNPEGNIVVDTATGEVMHGTGSILANAPGAEEECKANILDAFRDLQASNEAIRVAETYRGVKESTMKARQAVEEISLLGLVPGQCRVCRRLGI